MDPRQLEERTLTAAVGRGLVARELVERARQAAAARPGATLLGTLAGALQPDARVELLRLHQEQLRAAGPDGRAGAHAADAAQVAHSLVHGAPGPGSAARQLGPYTLERELARGGMGAVWVARRPGLDREVALKLLLGEDQAQVERFRTEARIAARLRHPGIVAIHDVGEDRGKHYLVMDLIKGQSLHARLEQGPLDPRQAVELCAKLARALAYAHAQAVLHRDLKPHNVLLDERGEPLLTDFGLAKDAGQEEGLTRTGQVMGTPAYMAPEQAEGQPDLIDRRTDVYGLGATLYELLTGRPPFAASTRMALIAAVLTKPPASPRALRPQVDRDLETIVLRCLEKEQEARYPSAVALAEDLERWLRDEPILARRPGPLERLARWRRRNRGLARALGAGAAAILLAAGLSGAALLEARLAREESARAERERLAGEARRELLAGQAQAANLASGAATGPLSTEDRARAAEPLLAPRLLAFAAAQRWHATAPQDPAAAAARLEAGLALGAAALEARQWALAELAYADAAGLEHPRREEGAAGQRQVRAEREQSALERQREARRVLDEVQEGAHRERTDGLTSAVFALVRLPEVEVVDEVCARLDQVTQAHRAATRAFYLAARPTPEELGLGWPRVEGLEAALEAWLERGEPERGLPALRAAETTAARRARALLRSDVKGQRVDHRVDLAREQAQELARRGMPHGLDLAQVCCETLGRLGRSTLERCGRLRRAEETLSTYLLVEAHPGQALRAALALARLEVPAARDALKVVLGLHGAESPLAAQLLDTPELRALLGAGSPAAPARVDVSREAPSGTEATTRQALALVAEGQIPQALGLLSEALDAARTLPARAHLQEVRLRVLLEARQTELVRPLLEELLQGDQNHAPWWLLRGVARRLDDELGPARQDLERALELAPRWVEPRVQLAEVLIRAGDLESASRFVDEALGLEPENALALSARAVVRRGRRDLRGALADARRAVELEPHLGEGWLRLAKLSAEADDLPGAEQAFARVLRMFGDRAFAWAERGHIRTIGGRPAEGLSDLDRAVELDPGLAEAWCSRGVALAFLDRPAEALASLDRALELAPALAEALLHRATLRAQSGRLAEARQDADAAVRAAPRDVGIRHLRARLCLFAEQPQAGWADLEEAARLDPGAAETWQLRAILCDAMGRYDDAEREFRRALDVAPESRQVMLDVAVFGLQRERLAVAERALQQLLRQLPLDPDGLRLRGFVRARQGDRPGAIADLERALSLAPRSDWAAEARRTLEALRRR